ncbi:MAG TPA: peptide-methionine (R)-S-oxide reductase MsrB [Bacteroidia bacterium]|jgi:methionine-R-sulfoxide reductase|nr:peptide-methionine (R)-S-oxide reductase MsrB [Bacteroidia bacterium]
MKLTLITFASLIMLSCTSQTTTNSPAKSTPKVMDTNYNKTDAEWKKTLTEEQYYVLREKGTDRPFTGKYTMTFEKGIYKCAACGYELFKDDQKFESHCGWPSFDSEIGNGDRIKKIKDVSLGMVRTEIVCARCGSHLGHIFDDGPTKTGMRYCVNSTSIDFEPEKK